MPGFDNKERLALYTHVRTFESDFDKSQSQIRAICSAWSAAVLGAIALIAVSAFTPPASMIDAGHAQDVIAREAHLAYVRGLICIVGSAGVLAFWFIDQRIYQRLLHSAFGYGLYMEFRNPDLPQIRSSMFIENLDVTSGLSWFYRVQFWLFLVIACVFVWQPFGARLGAVPDGIKGLTYVHAAIVIAGTWRGQKWPTLRNLIAEFYPDLAARMPASRVGPIERILREIDRFELLFPREVTDPQTDQANRDAWLDRIRAQPVPLLDPPPAAPAQAATP